MHKAVLSIWSGIDKVNASRECLLKAFKTFLAVQNKKIVQNGYEIYEKTTRFR